MSGYAGVSGGGAGEAGSAGASGGAGEAGSAGTSGAGEGGISGASGSSGAAGEAGVSGGGTGGSAGAGGICGSEATPNAYQAVDKYLAQPKVFPGGGSLCITASFKEGRASFVVDSADIQAVGNGPSAFPALVDGWNFDVRSSDTALPKPLSALTNVYTAGTTGALSTGSTYALAYDIWILPSADSAATASGAREIMIWLSSVGDVNPPGIDSGEQYEGFDVWTDLNGPYHTVTYRMLYASGFGANLLYFINDALARSGTPATGYLASVQFGYQIWQGGAGLKIDSFLVDAQ